MFEYSGTVNARNCQISIVKTPRLHPEVSFQSILFTVSVCKCQHQFPTRDKKGANATWEDYA